ncbi:hypothetical protein [Loktanella sp. 3ANDIMAR09]|uniref:hypothetical protein n=1 Tax=Loktanella sp. 3ANDIMAR09 TaxID=1225657 RepID=UPI00155F3E82
MGGFCISECQIGNGLSSLDRNGVTMTCGLCQPRPVAGSVAGQVFVAGGFRGRIIGKILEQVRKSHFSGLPCRWNPSSRAGSALFRFRVRRSLRAVG